MYLKAKEELWKLKYFTMQKIQSSKNPPKSFKISNSLTNLKFPTQAKTSVFRKNPHIKK